MCEGHARAPQRDISARTRETTPQDDHYAMLLARNANRLRHSSLTGPQGAAATAAPVVALVTARSGTGSVNTGTLAKAARREHNRGNTKQAPLTMDSQCTFGHLFL